MGSAAIDSSSRKERGPVCSDAGPQPADITKGADQA
jgi:hypothetical protein